VTIGNPRHSVVHVGLGPIGRSVAAIVATHRGLRAVAAVDPAYAGQQLAEVLGVPDERRIPVVRSLSEVETRADIALHCTSSSLRAVVPQLRQLIEAGIAVVSTCEELSYPWDAAKDEARAIDLLAREHGVAVLGTGVNPGFAMDYLAVTLSAVATRVDRVRVVRRADASRRRVPLQQKVGVGLSEAEFHRRVAARQLGHVGLRQSADAIASAFGWQIDSYDERIEPIVAEHETVTSAVAIRAGDVLGLHQTARARRDDAVVIDLDLTLAVLDGESEDRISLSGEPDVELLVPGGLHGDSATAAMVVNAIPRVLMAAPGLRTMLDIAPPHPWSSVSSMQPVSASAEL